MNLQAIQTRHQRMLQLSKTDPKFQNYLKLQKLWLDTTYKADKCERRMKALKEKAEVQWRNLCQAKTQLSKEILDYL